MSAICNYVYEIWSGLMGIRKHVIPRNQEFHFHVKGKRSRVSLPVTVWCLYEAL